MTCCFIAETLQKPNTIWFLSEYECDNHINHIVDMSQQLSEKPMEKRDRQVANVTGNTSPNEIWISFQW